MSDKINGLVQIVREKWVPDFKILEYSDAPFAKLNKTLKEARVTLITTGGVSVKGDTPFTDHYGLGDPSYREIPLDTPVNRLNHFHEHYDHTNANKDINCIFPIERMKELVEEGKVGSMTPYHYSFMGYVPIPHPLLKMTAPDIAKKLLLQGTEAVILVPT